MATVIEDWEDGVFDGWWNDYSPTINAAYAHDSGFGARFYASCAPSPCQTSYKKIWSNPVYIDDDMTGHTNISFWVYEKQMCCDAGGWGSYFHVLIDGGPSYTRNYSDGPSVGWHRVELDVSALSGHHTITIGIKGVWGTAEVYFDDLVYDYGITYTISGTISDEWGNRIRDANITISNGDTYTTTTDENGAYSKIVNQGTYNITISKPHSTLYDTTKTKSVTSDTTLNITMTTNKTPGKYNTSGMSIPGGISLGFK